MGTFEEHLQSVIRPYSGNVAVAEIKAAVLGTLPAELIPVVETIRASAGEKELDKLIRAALRHHRSDDEPRSPGLFDAYPTTGKRVWTMLASMTLAMWRMILERMIRDDARDAERRALKRKAFEQWGREKFGQDGAAVIEEFRRRGGADR